VVVSSPDALAELVRARRKDLGLTQVDVADLTGVSPRAIHDLERGTSAVTFKNLLLILEVLGLDVEVKVAPNG
jgi:y4mF family transcriptional regulator